MTPTNRGLKINDASMKRNSKFHEKNQRKIEKPVKSSQQTEKKNLEKSHKRANSSASKSGEPKKVRYDVALLFSIFSLSFNLRKH